MLICNNCGEPNPDHTDQCHHCYMVGDFTCQENEEKEEVIDEEPAVLQEYQPTCFNCAATISEMDDQCGYCHFPVVKTTESKVFSNRTPLKVWKKTA